MPNYGNWIRRRILINFFVAAMVALMIALLPLPNIIHTIVVIVFGLLLITLLIISYAYYQFSSSGGGYQHKLWAYVLEHLHWDGHGKVLDIGTGNGPLAVTLARQYPGAQVVGIDYWGADWEYSQQVCDTNAAAEGVQDRTTFQRASASSLPFDDGTFDAAVSHFVFHEVADTADKCDVIREALRVLRKGGVFSFQDMFFDTSLYPASTHLLQTIRSWGIDEVEFEDTRTALKIPLLLRHPRILGRAAIIYGRK